MGMVTWRLIWLTRLMGIGYSVYMDRNKDTEHATVTLTFKISYKEIADDHLMDCADGAQFIEFLDSVKDLLAELASMEEPHVLIDFDTRWAMMVYMLHK